jgi:peroxiredoxin
MGKYLKSIEVVANVLIIVVAVLCIGVLGHRYFRAESPKPAGPKMPVVGSTISAVDVDWSKNKKNVVLALQVGCHFCSESADFYKTLLRQTKEKGINVVAVLPQSREEARKYLDNLQLSDLDTKQSSLNSIDVSGTPTLIITDDKGQVTNAWVGKLPPEKQDQVLSVLLK